MPLYPFPKEIEHTLTDDRKYYDKLGGGSYQSMNDPTLTIKQSNELSKKGNNYTPRNKQKVQVKGTLLELMIKPSVFETDL